MRFTYDAYQLMLKGILDAGFTFSDYQHYAECERPCIIRHDIDFDLEKAYVFSNVEADFCERECVTLPSTYFVMLNTDIYNAYSSKNRSLLHKILRNGFQIGLHFDEKAYDDAFNAQDCIERVRNEAAVLSDIIGKSVTAVSMHRPSQSFLAANLDIPHMYNSYSKDFFSKFKYVSDSRMRWREDIEGLIRNRSINALHVLTHPIWYEEDESSMRDIIIRFIERASADRRDIVDHNIKDLASIISPSKE